MIKKLLLMASLLNGLVLQAQPDDYKHYPVYEGTDLGLCYTPQSSSFRVWAPTADSVLLLLYDQPLGSKPIEERAMKFSESGTWLLECTGDWQGKYYTYRAHISGVWMNEVPDPYSFATGVNGLRTAILDIHEAAPVNWQQDKKPTGIAATDALIYELHLRDASIHVSSGIQHKGRFLGLAEENTKNRAGLSTGLDHIRELGVTHVHLLPFFDFQSVDETKPDIPQYNWGYEPLNYNVPEGSYSSNAADPSVRIRELRMLVQKFHKHDLRLVMDVVYNHTMRTRDSWFNQLVPGYYYRQNAAGGFSDATACGNEIATERPMVRKYIIESLEFWMRQYHVDGFRFDLMGVHDIEGMNQIASRLRAIDPNVLLYGEGWTAGSSPLPDSVRALKKNVAQLDGIAVFSDDLRDGIKGSVFNEKERGFVSGRAGMKQSIYFGVAASCYHPQIDYSKINYSKQPYSIHPGQTISYAECHDNHVLWDKLALSAPESSEATRIKMHLLALGIVLTSQGVPFLHAGTEFLRSKNGNENSYNAGDSVNAIDWDLKTHNEAVYRHVKALIEMRRQHPAFRLRSGEQVREAIRFLDAPDNMVVYTIDGRVARDNWSKILLIYYAGLPLTNWKMPEGKWHFFQLPGQEPVYLQKDRTVPVKGPGLYVFYQE
ncbi:MAG: type I pullulanase [Chitinophagaceae bacterium]